MIQFVYLSREMVQAVKRQIRPATRWRRVWFFLPCAMWLLAASPLLAGNFYAGTSPSNVPWPGGVVPYEFTNTLTAAQQKTYFDGLREWQLAANVSFVPHTTQPNWVLFTYNTNFIDNVSPGFSPQVVTVSSLSRAQVCHEMGHSFGFTHENIRPDQTNYLTVIPGNVTPGNLQFFQIDYTSVTNGPYDFESVMHLGWDFASTQPGVLPTQQPKPPYFPRYQFRMGNLCLSPGDRAALKFLYGPPVVPLTNIVTTTADFGPGSLRAALYYVTDNPGVSVHFNVPTTDPGYSNGVYNIHLTGHLPPLVSNGMVIDGSTQPGFTGKPLIVVDGSQIIPETFTSDSGLLIYSSSNQVKNISFSGFDWNGLTLEFADATNNTIAGCWLGLDSTGSNSVPNAFQGILLVNGASHNTIGGTNALARNVISGNVQYGIWMSDSNTTGNTILGNYIGTDATGSKALPNGKSGVIIGAPGGNVLGSTNPAGRNVFSGNTEYGVFMTNTTGNVILGNYLGVNASGMAALANQDSGIAIFDSTSNLIGGTVSGAGNILSGNNEYGIDIRSAGTIGNLVQGNLIGLGAGGTNAIPNIVSGLLFFDGAQSNTIGGNIAGARNVISGNNNAGINITGTSNNIFAGNYIGTDITGTNSIANTMAGIYLTDGAQNNLIGGTTAAMRNVISGNINYGVYIRDSGTSGNLVEGNYIGTTPDGASALGNTLAGIISFGGAQNTVIGGGAGAGNVISGNYYGIYLAGTSGNWVQGNNIGTDATGFNALPNNNDGLIIFGGTTTNSIGLKPDGSGTANRIAFNFGDGIVVGDSDTLGITIRGNLIYSNSILGIDLVGPNDVYPYVTTNDVGDADTGPNNLQNFPVITNVFGLAANTVVLGKLNSTASHTFSIDVYRNLVPNFSGYGEGQFYLGNVSVTTDGSGNGKFALTNNAGNFTGQYFTATATAVTGDTSEFSLAVLATNAPVASASFTGTFQSGTSGFTFALTLQTNFTYRIQATTNLSLNPVPWIDLTNFTATNTPFNFTDRTATNYHVRFYRVVSP